MCRVSLNIQTFKKLKNHKLIVSLLAVKGRKKDHFTEADFEKTF